MANGVSNGPIGLCVKELAGALDVSKNYVYEMRRCGFRMAGVKRQGQTATVADAVRWIKENHFRLIDGRGVTRRINHPVNLSILRAAPKRSRGGSKNSLAPFASAAQYHRGSIFESTG